MPYSRGDVVKGPVPSIFARRGAKERWALVLSINEYNDTHDHGVFAAISTGVLSETLLGTYEIQNWLGAGLNCAALVTPWLYTLEWDGLEKTGELSPYELRQALEKLRQVVQI